MNHEGQQAEQFVCHYLKNQGLALVAQNYHCKGGEIDLIMSDQTYLIFIEVRYRQRRQFGGALESINRHKQQRLIHAATHFLQKYSWTQQWPSRFDVVTLTGHIVTPTLEWIKDAFQLY